MTNSRVSVGEEPVEVEPFVYSTSLVLSSLDKIRGDEGDYTCTVTVTPIGTPLYTPVTVMATKTVQVESKINLNLAILLPWIVLCYIALKFQLRFLSVANCENWRVSEQHN